MARLRIGTGLIGRPLRTSAAFPLALSLALACALSLGWARPARADGTYDGAWTMSSIAEAFTVQEWATACGPAPVSRTAIVGGPVTVTTSGGELVIAGRRTLRTDQCVDPLPTLARGVHTVDGGSWRTRCATPPSDPRQATINTAYFASGDTITLAETGRYEFVINDARCIADVKRSGSLARVVAAAASTATVEPPPLPAPAPTVALPAPAPRPDCSTPGEPARLEIRPSRKLLRAGDAFAFRGAVLDASGCPTGTPIQWSVNALAFRDGQPHAGVPAVDVAGKLTVPSQDFADATFEVVATAAGRSARASVQVAIPADYDALLAQSGLGSAGEVEAPAVAVLATSSIGTSDAQAEDNARTRRLVFIGVIAVLAVGLGIVAVIGSRRATRARLAQAAAEDRHAGKLREHEERQHQREARHAAQMKAHLASVALAQQQAAAAAARGIDTGPMFCPSCRREYPAGTGFCAIDANRLVAFKDHAALLSGPPGGVCPVCRKGYNPGVKVCPDDGEALLPPAVAAAPLSAQPRGKICPTCGGRFEGNMTFCGKDGTQLVLVN